MIRAIFFDIGNVLLNFSHEKMCQQVSRLCGIDEQLLWKTLMYEGIGKEYELGHMTTQELITYISTFATLPYTEDELYFAFGNIFCPNETIIPLIKKLKEKEIRLILLSNVSEMHIRFLFEQYPFLADFDHAALSFQIKAMKPHPKIFQSAMQAANCNPNECFYTDDILEYVQAAQKLGIDAEAFISTDQFIKDIEKRGLILP